LSTLNKMPTQSAPSTPSKSDKTCKILFKKTSEDEWLAFQSQSEVFLLKFHDLDALGIQTSLNTATDRNDIPDHDTLLARDLDAVWTALLETITSAAQQHLPSVSVGYGGVPTMSPEKAHLQARKNDFGNTVRAI
ncbi:hypothetical protein BG006_002989, partial [Podila minutissima]